MKITVMSIFVTDQRAALAFYTDVLGFVLADDIPMGDYSWLTVASAEDPSGVQISLEPNEHPAVVPFTTALVTDGIPFTSFEVESVQTEYERLVALGVEFTQPPTSAGPFTTAIFNDTVGNLIQIAGGA